MSNEIVVKKDNQLDMINLNTYLKWSEMISKSSFCPPQFKGKPEEVLLCLQYAHEIEVSPMQALQNIAVINNKPAVYGDLMLALCIRHPDWIKFKETIGDDWAQCSVYRKGYDEPITWKFTKQDALDAGLWGTNVWKKYPKRMMQMRARGFALRNAFPDALNGILSVEEARDYRPDADYISDGIQAEVVMNEHKQIEDITHAEVVDERSEVAQDVINLCDELQITEAVKSKWLTKAKCSRIEDMNAVDLEKCLEWLIEQKKQAYENQQRMQHEEA